MDLALEIGIPAESLARTMTEHELRLWRRYAKKKLLPTQRLELYLAQVAQLIAATMGGAKNTKISDFMIRLHYEEQEIPTEIDIEEMRKAFGYSPRKKRTA